MGIVDDEKANNQQRVLSITLKKDQELGVQEEVLCIPEYANT